MISTGSNFRCSAELEINTRGYCFICLKKAITSEIQEYPKNSNREETSKISDLFHYLKISLEDFVSDQRELDSHANNISGRLPVTVELCKNCKKLTERISKLICVKQTAEMEISYQLGSIHELILESGRTPTKMRNYQRVTNGDMDNGRSSLIEVDGIRKQFSTKCSKENLKLQPRVIVRKITPETEQLSQPRSTLRDFEENESSIIDSVPNPTVDNLASEIKIEMAMDPSDSTPISFAPIVSEIENIVEPSLKLKCKICMGIYADLSTLNNHMEQIHGFGVSEEAVALNMDLVPGVQLLASEIKTEKEPFSLDTPCLSERESFPVPELEGLESSLKCKICMGIYADLPALNSHMEQIHVIGGFQETVASNMNSVSSVEILTFEIKTEVNPSNDQPTPLSPVGPFLPEMESSALPKIERITAESSLSCKICMGIYADLPTLNNHMEQIHGISDSEETVASSVDSVPTVDILASEIKTEVNPSNADQPTPIFPDTPSPSERESFPVPAIDSIAESSLKCKTCMGIFADLPTLHSHMEQIHGRKMLECPHCKHIFIQKLYKKHILYCSTSIIYNRRRSKRSSIQCQLKYCSKSFITDSSLAEHYKTAHPDFNPKTNVNLRERKCHICGEIFYKKSLLREHKFSAHFEPHHNCNFPGCGERFFRNPHLQKHKFVRLEPKHSCNFPGCGERFFKKAHLQKHSKSVHLEPKHNCNFSGCLKKYRTVESLVAHWKRKRGTKPNCDICSKDFSALSSLMSHLRVKHPTQPKCKCTTCGKKFSGSDYLKTHMDQDHLTNTQPLNCTVEADG